MGLRLVNGQTDAGVTGKTVLTADANGNIIATPFGGTAKTISGNVLNSICDGRLTLTSATPVLSADVTAATTVYFTPYKGNQTALYFGGAWGVYTFTEPSITLSGATASIGYDFFSYWDPTGTPAVKLEKLAWTSATARATALAYQDGILVKSGDPTRKYLGSAYMSATGQTEVVFNSTSRAPMIGLWNYYNRVNVGMQRKESTASWAYTTAAWRQANASTNNQCSIMIGVIEDDCNVNIFSNFLNAGAVTGYIGLGQNTTSSPVSAAQAGPTGSNLVSLSLSNVFKPVLGLNTFTQLEYTAGATTTFYGSSLLTGISVQARC